jgi:hypothetical protein
MEPFAGILIGAGIIGLIYLIRRRMLCRKRRCIDTSKDIELTDKSNSMSLDTSKDIELTDKTKSGDSVSNSETVSNSDNINESETVNDGDTTVKEIIDNLISDVVNTSCTKLYNISTKSESSSDDELKQEYDIVTKREIT